MPNPDKKYPTYESLAEAFRTGELDPKKFVLRLDNDNCYLARTDTDDPDESEEAARLDDEARELFDGNGCYYEDVLEMLRAAGIPAESV